MTRSSATHPWCSASRIIRPRRGSTGRRARRRPTLVNRTSEPARSDRSSAPSSSSSRHAVGDGAGVGRLDEREGRHVTESERGHLEDDRRQVGPQDLRLGERGPAVEVLLGVEADAGAGCDAAAAAGPLVGRRLRDRLDGQALHLRAAVVAGDASRAGVDDADDAGHGERRLGHVGGQHDPPPAVRREHPVLLGGREPGVERQDLDVRQAESSEGLGGVADLPLAGEEHEDVAGPLLRQLDDGVADRLRLVAVVTVVVSDRAVADLHRVRATGHLHHRGVVEVGREAGRVDGGRGDDHLEVGPLRQQLVEVAEQEVDVEAALVGLVDDEDVVGRAACGPAGSRPGGCRRSSP